MTQIRLVLRIVVLAALATGAASCGDVARSGQSPVYLVINKIEAKRGGGSSTELGGFLMSDVLTNVSAPAPCSPTNPCPTIFNDVGVATFSLAAKDVSVTPTSNNWVTLNRFRIVYRRSDGRNTPGVDVPHPWEGTGTATVQPAGGSFGFEIVRHAAKLESPLVQLRNSPSIITTTAEITFYGTDRVGNDVSVTGSIQVDFGNFGD